MHPGASGTILEALAEVANYNFPVFAYDLGDLDCNKSCIEGLVLESQDAVKHVVKYSKAV